MIKIQTGQLDSIRASLKEFSDQVKTDVAFSGVAAMAKVVYDEVKENVSGITAGMPKVKTGNLRDSIYRVYSPEKSGDTLKTYRISWNKRKAPHGHLLEFGTSRAPAHPFLGPASDRMGDAIKAGQDRMAEKLQEIKGGT